MAQEFDFNCDNETQPIGVDVEDISTLKSPYIPIERHNFLFTEYHVNKWKQKDITVIICQKVNIELIRLSLESLLRFYPDVQIIIATHYTDKESLLYINDMVGKYRNITTVDYKVEVSVNSHGVLIDYVVRNYLKTKYFLCLDSDVIIERSGFIEEMLSEFKNDESLYGLGALVYSWYNSDRPRTEIDNVPYVHPHCAMFNKQIYLSMNNSFQAGGDPFMENMKEAKDKNIKVRCFNVDRYMLHLEGGSWQEHKKWSNVYKGMMRFTENEGVNTLKK